MHFPWDDDAEGMDEFRRVAEARARQAVVELQARVRQVVEEARDRLLQVMGEQAITIAELKARVDQLEQRLGRGKD